MPLPVCPLSPYTTLFRSSPCGCIGCRLQRGELLFEARGVRSEPVRPAEPGTGSLRTPRASKRDRKSTRLNSSHRCISYAVFCLKKKKKKTMTVYHSHAEI